MTVRQFQCRGNEPFWSLVMDEGEARLSRPLGEKRESETFEGRMDHLEYLDPSVSVWRGASGGKAGDVLVAVMRRGQCLDTMSDEGPDFTHAAVASLSGERPLAGCCTAIMGLDLAAAPVADVAARDPGDWTRNLPDLLPAIEGCLKKAEGTGLRVLHAAATAEGRVTVRLQDDEGRRRDCIATSRGKAKDIADAPESDGTSGEGGPVLYPASGTPPILDHGRAERVLDGKGRLRGFLHYADEPRARSALYATEWIASLVEGSAADPKAQQTLTFAASGQVNGRAGCNFLAGQAKFRGEKLELGPLVTTRRACAPEIMEAERRFLDVLGRVVAWRLAGDDLELLDAAGAAVVTLAPGAPVAPAGEGD
ncbi:MAG TPA: META domain-containing protein [Sphingomonadales bacterium]